MTNLEIAKKISEIGDMLEILDNFGDQFRIIAYHNAARKIEMMNEQIEDIYKLSNIGGLEEIPGIGQSIALKIEELLKTGQIQAHQELARKVPSAILEFTKIPGVGPKFALKLYQNYHVADIKELQKALQSDQTEKFFKDKTKENILQGIDYFYHLTGRMLLSFAEPIARDILEKLRAYPEVGQADVVGSLRRMKETVGDIDIVAALRGKSQIPNPKPQINSKFQILNSKKNHKSKIINHQSKIIDQFIHEPFVYKVISHGETKATIVHIKGPQIDLEILPSDEYGSLLQHFTGSKEHNIALRTWGEKRGFSISEHGIKITQNSKVKSQNHNLKLKTIKCNNEEKVYQTLGMSWIVPELRENRGEIEAALQQAQGKPNSLPNLVELKDINGDLHLHSTWSEGDHSIVEMAKFCQELGYQYMAITDHTAGLGITHGLKEKDVEKYLKEISDLNYQLSIIPSQFRIFSGAEANIMADGKIDFKDGALAKLDIVIASIHSGFGQNKEKITQRLLGAIENPHVDIIGHPSGRLIERRRPLAVDWQKVFQAAAKTGTLMEINAQPDRLDLNDDLIMLAKKLGVKFVISSDSHHHIHLKNLNYGVAMARRGWLEKTDVLNCQNSDKLLDYIGKKKHAQA